MSVLPPLTEASRGSAVVWYCEQIGVDFVQYSEDTAVRFENRTSDHWSAAQLLGCTGRP
jgi:hypothetical protein